MTGSLASVHPELIPEWSEKNLPLTPDTKDPQPGDQIFFGTSLDNSTHTGIVESVDKKQVHTALCP